MYDNTCSDITKRVKCKVRSVTYTEKNGHLCTLELPDDEGGRLKTVPEHCDVRIEPEE